MTSLPTGTVAFLMSDIEGSTRLAAATGNAFPELLDAHFALMREAITDHGGTVVSTEGDSVFAVLPTARAAVLAAINATRALAGHAWPDGRELRVRIGIHVGEALFGGRDYTGIDVHRAARVMAAGWGGEIVVSQAVRALVGDGLEDGIELRDLGVHALRDIADPERLYQVVAPGLRTEFPPPRTESAAARTNLPTPLTRFVGRARELAEVEQLLASERMVTLVGPGGTGKTRLAIEVARASLPTFTDGVFFVALDQVRDADLVMAEIAQTLGLIEDATRPVADTLTSYLAGKRVLIVLDNLEQVIGAAPGIAALVASAPRLVVLGSSREPLGVAGERVYHVPPLALPSEPGHPSAAQLAGEESVVLFIERARAARPGFELTDANAPAVAAICRRVDGLPLAIELAAARVNVLTPEQILERLDHRLTLLAGARRDVTDRQRTLRGAIDWSYELLSDDEKAGFRRFAAFAGGADLDAALAVLDSDRSLSIDPIDLLGALVGRSLLRSSDESGESRFAMLETIREYALEKLLESGEEAEVCQRHCAYFATLAEASSDVLFAPDRDARLDKLDREMPNFRAAIEWSLRRNDVGTAAQFAVGLKEFWRTRSHIAEARRLLDGMLELAGRIGDKQSRARILAVAAELASWATDYRRSAELGQAHLALLDELGDRAGLGAAFQNMGWSTLMSAPEQARDYFERSVAVGREIGDQHLLIGASQGLGIARLRLGDIDGAREAATLTLDSDGAGQDRYTNLYNYLTLGAVDLLEGNFAASARSFAEALNRASEASSDVGIIVVLDSVSHVAIEMSDLSTAVKLYCVADRLRAQIGGAPAAALIGWATTIDAAREKDSAATDVAAEESLAMTKDDAVALATDFLRRVESP